MHGIQRETRKVKDWVRDCLVYICTYVTCMNVHGSEHAWCRWHTAPRFAAALWQTRKGEMGYSSHELLLLVLLLLDANRDGSKPEIHVDSVTTITPCPCNRIWCNLSGLASLKCLNCIYIIPPPSPCLFIFLLHKIIITFFKI